MVSSLQHSHLASLSANLFSSIPLCPGTQVMWMWESLFFSRNSCAHLENMMESNWDGCVCVREMLEIAGELLV